MGFVYGNRAFFPDPLVTEARMDFVPHCERASIRPIQMGRARLLSLAVSRRTPMPADAFRGRADELDGIVVVLPNFGDEKEVGDTLKASPGQSSASRSTGGKRMVG
jgi:hypothetical protein